MKTLTLSVAVAALATFQAFAQDAAIDADGDGVYNMTELQTAFPELTDELFTAIDVNADGAVDMEEMQAAQDAALLPATDG
ncbi:EF-hand domain-containing protein [Parasulfitobacter algicola]|uniref:EF-hand domain-containing protein n=1 Tax=Parasulfitobacter algicola TaxID=2614809 RepID=A0ABX2IRZ7_9RHOB|nr:EF-hand domain-containing protein [Sulfitobacter algicola]NSX55666.1 EF-hand domain-containing protein [Sulfitobacter algicola]